MATNPGRFVPTQQRRTARRPALSRARIVEAALAMADRGELEALSMRRLAAELGAAPMSLYRHIRGRDDLLDEVVDAMLLRLDLPDDTVDWEGWLTELGQGLYRLLVDHRTVLDVFTAHPVATPAALRRMERTLVVLRRAGFEPQAAMEAYAAVHTYAVGLAALTTAGARDAPGHLAPEIERYWAVYFATLDHEEYPALASLAPNLSAFTSPAQFELGLARLVTGIRASLHATGTSTST